MFDDHSFVFHEEIGLGYGVFAEFDLFLDDTAEERRGVLYSLSWRCVQVMCRELGTYLSSTLPDFTSMVCLPARLALSLQSRG